MNQQDPAEIEANKALEQLYDTIDNNKSFRFEAGAGAGKTYSLIKALKHLSNKKEHTYQQVGQKIACITYTNIAVKEIEERTSNSTIIEASTIHSFCWTLLKPFQKELKKYIADLSDNWPKRIEDAGGIKNQNIIYDLGYPTIDEREIHLYHDDVIKLMTWLLANQKFQQLIKSKYPVIFIDEYQDTNKDLMNSMLQNLITTNSANLIGLFGDHWQKIYDNNTCGLVDNDLLAVINKGANFRSTKIIVDALNMLRPELKQKEKKSTSTGTINIYHTNKYSGHRNTKHPWQGDLMDDISTEYFEKVKAYLIDAGWEFNTETTKILMLTNKVLAKKQGYENLANCFKESEDYIKKNDPYIKYFLEILEPFCEYYKAKKYGEMLHLINKKTPILESQSDKTKWQIDIEQVMCLRSKNSIKEIISHLQKTKRPRLSPKIEELESKLKKIDSDIANNVNISEEDKKFKEKRQKLMQTPYIEVQNLFNYVEKATLFSTKHGVKGAEFENVLVVLGRGWPTYDWNKFLEFHKKTPDNDKDKAFYIKNRNLFYVASSRAKKNLALLFTQKLSSDALDVLNSIFDNSNVKSLCDTKGEL